MLILLPPSEGKTAPRRGRTLRPRLAELPGAAGHRARCSDALVAPVHDERARSRGRRGRSASGPTQTDEVAAQRRGCARHPTARADTVYSGVLYEALDLGIARRRRRGAVRRRGWRSRRRCSACCGRPTASRPTGCPATCRCPGIGTVSTYWSRRLDDAVARGGRPRAGGRPAVVDVRGVLAARAATWRAACVTVRVLHETGGRRKVVSHFNKATKGRHRARRCCRTARRRARRRRFADQLGALGWKVELGAAGRTAPRSTSSSTSV